ncbi:hypothetical protein QVD17_18140 [Tagetes erecta]|uniref:Uncharacterized protein n=1 Tax=Tagetes erecta TaxID=13708 RepID=A0AAD8NW32_TARER|nr:hypothetical protein QVD17_18140 [Tagetes erecta]
MCDDVIQPYIFRSNFFSSVLCCVASPRVSEEDDDMKKMKQVVSPSKSKPKSRGAPIPVSYFPVGSNVSRL